MSILPTLGNCVCRNRIVSLSMPEYAYKMIAKFSAFYKICCLNLQNRLYVSLLLGLFHVRVWDSELTLPTPVMRLYLVTCVFWFLYIFVIPNVATVALCVCFWSIIAGVISDLAGAAKQLRRVMRWAKFNWYQSDRLPRIALHRALLEQHQRHI